MFKFVHAADIHLDSPLRGLSIYESAPVEAIRSACRRAFENLVDLAIEEKVAFVLLAGDLYDRDWKDYSTGIFLSRQLGRLNRHDIAVFAVSGNHDAANRITGALDWPANMKIFPSRKGETFRHEALGVAIHGRSFASQHVDENLAAGFPPADKGMFNIGLLHTSLDGRAGHAVYAPCKLDDLLNKGYQYWALGHIHKPEFVSEDPWIVFPGCIQGRHIRESGPRGCVLVTVEDGAVQAVERRSTDVLRWALCEVDLTDVRQMHEALECTRLAMENSRISSEGRPVAMRVRFTGATTLAGDLAAYPERIESQVKALGAEIAEDDLWIERVENAALGRVDPDAVVSGDSALGALLEDIRSLPNNANAVDGIQAILGDLRQKIPSEAFSEDIGLNLDQDPVVERLVREAKELLIGRLLKAGGAE